MGILISFFVVLCAQTKEEYSLLFVSILAAKSGSWASAHYLQFICAQLCQSYASCKKLLCHGGCRDPSSWGYLPSSSQKPRKSSERTTVQRLCKHHASPWAQGIIMLPLEGTSGGSCTGTDLLSVRHSLLQTTPGPQQSLWVQQPQRGACWAGDQCWA